MIRRNSALLPAYSLVLALIALLGFMAVAARVDKMPEFADLFAPLQGELPRCRRCSSTCSRPGSSGFAFAAIGIGALVPAAIMSIAAANLWTRNVYIEFINPNASPRAEAQHGEVGVADRQVRRAVLHPRPAARLRDPAAAARRRVDEPDAAAGDARACSRAGSNSWALLLGWATGHRPRHLDGGAHRLQERHLRARRRGLTDSGLCGDLWRCSPTSWSRSW